jgi:GDP-4-dehydro-6-deoxy-D-mannose reductase
VRALVTGGSGFAGGHLVEHLRACGDEVVTVSRSGDLAADLLDPQATARAVAEATPDVVYHLAAQAHVGRSWADPAATLNDNLAMTLNVLGAVRSAVPEATVVAVSSGEVYGPPATLPVDEHAELRPQNPYAVSKASADLLARFHADAYGMRVVRPRAFNHAGPRQEPAYAIASFARQVALGAAAGEDPVVVETGNPDTRRDYTDVRDVVRAYRLLALHGEPGEAYNVCSGRTASAAELVAACAAVAGVRIDHRVDRSLVRAHEVMEIRGSFEKLRAATGWEPEIDLETTLRDTMAWWREQAAASQPGGDTLAGAGPE